MYLGIEAAALPQSRRVYPQNLLSAGRIRFADFDVHFHSSRTEQCRVHLWGQG